MLDHDTPVTAEGLLDAHERILELERENLLLTKQVNAHQIDAERLAHALKYTQEYLGNATLPPIGGWDWYDALKLHYGPDWEPS